jgi:hypothetical protein
MMTAKDTLGIVTQPVMETVMVQSHLIAELAVSMRSETSTESVSACQTIILSTTAQSTVDVAIQPVMAVLDLTPGNACHASSEHFHTTLVKHMP